MRRAIMQHQDVSYDLNTHKYDAAKGLVAIMKVRALFLQCIFLEQKGLSLIDSTCRCRLSKPSAAAAREK